ncbi:MAG: hypothetical protein ACXV9T_03415 [Methylobacter sp.]
MVKMNKLSLMLFLIIFCSNSLADSSDWMSHIDASCQKTIKGLVAGIFSKDGFWKDTHVSMQTWADDMRLVDPRTVCRNDYVGDKDNKGYTNCTEFFKKNWDWYYKCLPIVGHMLKNERK